MGGESTFLPEDIENHDSGHAGIHNTTNDQVNYLTQLVSPGGRLADGEVGGGDVPDASTTVKGSVELATTAETTTGTDATRAVTPAGLSAALNAAAGLPDYVGAVAHRDTWDPATQTYNITPSAFERFRLALAKSKAAVTPAFVTFDGDSITSGIGLTTRQTNAWPEQCRALMAASGRWGNVYEAGPQAGVGADGVSGNNDSRLTWGGTVGASAGLGAFGICGTGGEMGGNAGGVITFGPVNCDEFIVYDRLAGLGGAAGWTWAVDGGSGTFVAQTGSGTDQGTRATVISAGSYGSHTLTITLPGGGNYGVISGIGVRKNADAGGVYFARRGMGGANAGTSASMLSWNHAVGLEMAYTTQKSDLAVISLGTNPEPSGFVPADWKTHVGSLITSVQGRDGDVLLALAPPGGGGVSGPQAAYLAAIAPLAYQLADEHDVGLVDIFSRWGADAANSIDQYFQQPGSSGHPNQAGANDFAFGVFNALVRVA